MRTRNKGLAQYEAICQHLGIEIEKPKSIDCYGEAIPISLFPKLIDLTPTAITFYNRKNRKGK